MARKNETALMYSSVPCDILNRRSTLKAVHMARRDHLGDAFITAFLFIIVYLQVVLHGSKLGYYATLDEEFVEDMARETCIDDNDVLKALELAAKANVIDRELYVENKIVTSQPIQEAYFSAMARGRRRRPLETPYLLVDLDNYHFVGDGASGTEGNGISSEEKEITSEETKISSEEKGITSEAKTSNVKSNSNVMYLSLAERKDIELFFHSQKGLRAWSEITEDMVGRMDSVGWNDAARRPILDRVKYAKAWRVPEKFAKRGSIFADDDARAAYAELYSVLSRLPECYVLTKIIGVKLNGRALVLSVQSQDVMEFVNLNTNLIKSTVKHFNGINYEKPKKD